MKDSASGMNQKRLSIIVGNVRVRVEVAAVLEQGLDLLGEFGVLGNPTGEHSPRDPLALQGDAKKDGDMIANLSTLAANVPNIGHEYFMEATAASII